MNNHDAAALVTQALTGDSSALSRLVRVLTPVVQARAARALLARRTLLAAGRNVRQEVEDASQEIFLLLFAHEGRVLKSWQAERGLSLENFVGLVTERQVVSYLRSGRRNPWREEGLEAEDFAAAAPEPGPEEVTASREELRLLLDRLREAVSPLGWRLFELLFIRELPLPEVVAESGLSADAVYAWKSRLRRLGQKLSERHGAGRIPSRESGP